MLHVELRQCFAINGLLDDVVVHGTPADYIAWARTVESAIHGQSIATLDTASHLRIEIDGSTENETLMTSLQNEDNVYLSMQDWERRDILRMWACPAVLEHVRLFLVDLSGRGEGYSYLSEFSDAYACHHASPEWRLHVL